MRKSSSNRRSGPGVLCTEGTRELGVRLAGAAVCMCTPLLSGRNRAANGGWTRTSGASARVVKTYEARILTSFAVSGDARGSHRPVEAGKEVNEGEGASSHVVKKARETA